jgi:hypothetical protein
MARYQESEETPAMEARTHSVGFLKRAATMARKKKGRKRARGRGKKFPSGRF